MPSSKKVVSRHSRSYYGVCGGGVMVLMLRCRRSASGAIMPSNKKVVSRHSRSYGVCDGVMVLMLRCRRSASGAMMSSSKKVLSRHSRSYGVCGGRVMVVVLVKNNNINLFNINRLPVTLGCFHEARAVTL
ncbi:MAG: hypothetical protein ABFS08_06055 [Pseudomonadota bacterium]